MGNVILEAIYSVPSPARAQAEGIQTKKGEPLGSPSLLVVGGYATFAVLIFGISTSYSVPPTLILDTYLTEIVL